MPARATDHPALLPTRPDNYPTARALQGQFASRQSSERLQLYSVSILHPVMMVSTAAAAAHAQVDLERVSN